MTPNKQAALDALKLIEHYQNHVPLILQRHDCIETIRAALLAKDEVQTVTRDNLAGDMVNALYDYKLQQGHFSDAAAKVVIDRLIGKYPNGLKVTK